MSAYHIPGFVLDAGYTKKNRTWLINFTSDGGPADLITGEFEFTLNQVPERNSQIFTLHLGETSEYNF